MVIVMSTKILYRISFSHSDSVYELYAKKISESDIFGFLLVEDIVFGETTSIVVDPGEEKLKMEFHGVKNTFIPVQAVLRIDEVSKQGVSKVREKSVEFNKVSLFPIQTKPKD